MSDYINNTESPGELARLIKQAVLLDACREIVPRSLQDRPFRSILDIGCGPGNWAIQVSSLYPSADVIGIDISKAMISYAQARVQVLTATNNVGFEVRDALDATTFPLEDEDYDLINLSLASSWVPDERTWQTLLRQCYAMLNPSGAVVVTESELALTTSKALNRLQTIILSAFQANGRSPHGSSFGVATHLGRTLREAGFQKGAIEVNAFDFSYYNPMENMAWRDTIPILVYETKTFLLAQGVTTEQELEEVAYQAQIEMYQEDFCGIAPLYTFIGRKEEGEQE
jgi:SAM-dependent methyltransferase